MRPGVRALDADLHLRVRTSRGGSHKLTLPKGAKLQSFSIDGQHAPTQESGDALGFTLLPGKHDVTLSFQLPEGVRTFLTVPEVKIYLAGANVRVSVQLPSDRLILWAKGPSWGPAILFWGYLLLVLGVAFALGRVPGSPLSSAQWLLLGLGLTHIDAVLALFVVTWFFAFEKRRTSKARAPWLHNLTQLALLFITFLAAGALYDALHTGLLVRPDMQVQGAGSSDLLLNWYVDRTSGQLPTPSIVSVPLWIYRALMLVWALWLARTMMRYLPWAFSAYSAGGLWKRSEKKLAIPGWSASPNTAARPAGAPAPVSAEPAASVTAETPSAQDAPSAPKKDEPNES